MKWLIALLSLSLIAPCGIVRGQTDTSRVDATPQGTEQQGTAPQGAERHWNLLQKDGYSIQYPPEWTAATSGMGETSFALFAPTASHHAVFRQNINLVVKDVSADTTVTLEELMNVNVEMLKAAFTDFAVISALRLKDATGEYQQMVFEFQQQGYFLKQLQEYRIIHGKAYYLTFTSLRSRYETYMDEVGDIFKSFKIGQ